MAQRLQQKRSSIAGRRPDASYLEPGELAVNTNASDPGLFFEGNDGSIVKAGPTAVSVTEPSSAVGYGHGENWYETGNKELNVWSASEGEWETVLAPTYGGSEQLIYVGTEFPEATDDLSNDGRSRPFASFNRACMEVARRSILQGRSDEPKQGKFTIILLPGTNIARNEPGIGMENFNDEVGSFFENQQMSVDLLRKFNPVNGGIVLPRGCSVVGMDPHKSKIHPTFYPRWSREEFESGATMVPRSSIFHATGDSLINRLSFGDKIKNISITNIEGEFGEVATLHTLEPHGVRSLILDESGTNVLDGDFVYLNYPPLVPRTNQGIRSVDETYYWAEPITDKTLRIRRVLDLSAILRRELPSTYSPGSVPNDFFSLTVSLKTHHRLSTIQFASEPVLQEYYTKIQYAFSELNFGGAIDDSEINDSEINVGIALPSVADTSVDDVTHRVPTIREVSILSNYGMCGLTADGSAVGGMKQISCYDLRYKGFQNDPDVYEVFYDGVWMSLKEATSRGSNIDINDVTDEMARKYLINSVHLENLRLFYRTSKDVPGSSGQSSGLSDPESDTRHYALLATKNGKIEGLNQVIKGAGVAFWAKEGGAIDIENANCFLGIESIRSEGFSGIMTLGGAEETQKGYEVVGIRRPSLISARELADASNRQLIYLNSSIEAVTATTIKFYRPINTSSLLPYSLRPGSVIWVSDITDGNLYSAMISADGLSEDGLTLNVEIANNEILNAPLNILSIPYIRRFLDPRDPTQRSYYLEIRNTSENHTPPNSGMILRFAENQGSNVTQLIEPGRQLDPGENGGWNHMFVVHQSQSYEEGNNPNEVHKWDKTPNRAPSYYISLKLSDSFGPWNSSEDSARGTSATYENRAFLAEYTDITDTPSMVPTEEKSEWTLANRSEFAQPVGEAYIDTTYVGGVDPLAGTYTPTDTYLRGVKCSDEDYDQPAAIDLDDGTFNFGLTDPNQPEIADLSKIDADYAHSKRAIARFLSILGYSNAQMASMLVPQYWNDRDLPVSQFPTFDCKGYGLSVGNWPVEFSSPSTVLATGVVWELPGHLNNSKGLDQYRKSTLSKAQRFNSMNKTVWGGRTIVQGQNQLGETLPIEIDSERRTDDIF